MKVWIATGATDMRRGMNGLSLQVQEAFGRDPHAGDLYVFRGRRGDLIKVLGMTGSGCRFTPSVSNEAASSGRQRLRAWLRSRRHNSATCWRRSTGETRNRPGGRRALDRLLQKNWPEAQKERLKSLIL
jgi:transposase